VTEPGRTRRTDERLDDLAGELREFRAESRQGFRELREQMRELRSEFQEELRQQRGELYSTRRWTVNLWATTVVGFVAVLIQTSLRS
jgi:uncharacterized coiled-coil DUF342 family protein